MPYSSEGGEHEKARAKSPHFTAHFHIKNIIYVIVLVVPYMILMRTPPGQNVLDVWAACLRVRPLTTEQAEHAGPGERTQCDARCMLPNAPLALPSYSKILSPSCTGRGRISDLAPHSQLAPLCITNDKQSKQNWPAILQLPWSAPGPRPSGPGPRPGPAAKSR